MTAVANAALTAAQWNTHVRDNLMETLPAKVNAARQIGLSTGPNAIKAVTAFEPLIHASNTAIEGFTNTSYVSGSPQVGLVFTAGDSGRALIAVSGRAATSVVGSAVFMSFEVREGDVLGSGNQVVGPHADRSVATGEVVVTNATSNIGASFLWVVAGLTSGDDYNVRHMYALSPDGSGQPDPAGSIYSRSIIVLPFW